MGLWDVLDSPTALDAILVEWRKRLGEDFENARFLLQISDKEASAYPCPTPYGEGCPRRIVKFSETDIEAVCDDLEGRCGSVKLSLAEITLHRLDLRKLSESLAMAFRIQPEFEEAGYRRAWVGRFVLPTGRGVDVHLALPSSKAKADEVIADLCLRKRSCLLLLPSPRHLSPKARDAFEQGGGRAIYLNEIVALTSNQEFETTFDLRTLFEPSPGPGVEAPDCVFQPQGEFWQLTFGGRSVQLKSIKGLSYLAALLRYPDRGFSHLDLTLEVGEGAADTVENISREDGLSVSASPEAAHEVLDRRAIREYQSTLNDLKAEWENANRNDDRGTAERLKMDIDQIEEQLIEGLGFGGRSHRKTEAAKSLRDRVNQAIRGARGKIEEHHPELDQHLATSLHRQGEWCYRPGCAITWVT